MPFDGVGLGALRDHRKRVEKPRRLSWLELVGRARDVDEHLSAGLEDARALGEAARKVDVHEDVAAPDPVRGVVVDRHLLDAGL